MNGIILKVLKSCLRLFSSTIPLPEHTIGIPLNRGIGFRPLQPFLRQTTVILIDLDTQIVPPELFRNDGRRP